MTALRIKVVVVTFEAGSVAQAYVSENNLPWPLLVDESRALYAAYGMERGNWWNIYGPGPWLVYAKLLLKGRRLRRLRGNFDQLGGDVLIDPEGIVCLHHVGSGPADRPSVKTLLDLVRK